MRHASQPYGDGVCTVLLRFRPGARWPVLLGAVRDEFVDREWDGPAHHWPAPWDGLVGGQDRRAGGTWLAVDPRRPALAALLNGPRRDPRPGDEPRPTRGRLALRLLVEGDLPEGDELAPYDRFHLLLATPEQVDLWSWDAEQLRHRAVEPGNHLIVNTGLDDHDDPLVPHFDPLLAAVPDPDPAPGVPPAEAWGAWLELLTGDGLDPLDERALVVRRPIEDRTYGTTSATLLALSSSAVRYDFTATPSDPSSWVELTT